MKTFQNTEFDIILVKASGIALFTFAFAKLPSAIAALVQIISALTIFRWNPETYADKMMQQLSVTLTSSAIGNLLSFLLLLLLARWVFRYPKLLRKWLKHSEEADAPPQA